jgi:transcription initiation factor TFIIB
MLTENNSKTNQTKCEMCSGTLIFDVQTDERVCNGCGVVIPACDELLHNVTCAHEKNIERQPVAESLANNMMYEISLPTFIGERNIDANGKQIRSSSFDRMRRLDRITLANDNKIRNLNRAVREIRRITEILGLKTSVAERATYIYRKAFGLGLIRGRSISGIAAASIYIACKEFETPHSIHDIEKMIDGLGKKNILRYQKMLLKVMKINLGLPSPISHISKIAERTGLSGKIERKALDILSKVSSNSLLVGKKPISIAAAALYLASVQTKQTTQLRVAIATDLTTITIRKRCNEIMQILDEIKQEEMEKTKSETTSLPTESQLADQVPILVEQTS